MTPPTERRPSAGAEDPRIRRSWFIFAGTFFALGLISVLRLFGPGARPLDAAVTALIVIVGFAAVRNRLAVQELEHSRRAEAESFARILQGLSRSISPDAIVGAIVEELGRRHRRRPRRHRPSPARRPRPRGDARQRPDRRLDLLDALPDHAISRIRPTRTRTASPSPCPSRSTGRPSRWRLPGRPATSSADGRGSSRSASPAERLAAPERPPRAGSPAGSGSPCPARPGRATRRPPSPSGSPAARGASSASVTRSSRR